MTDTLLTEHVVLSSIKDLPVIRIQNDAASATIALQGAHVLEYSPVNQGNVLFVSDGEKYLSGKAIRGGIPVCWPWFGDHSQLSDAPAHGLVRAVEWDYEIVADNTDRTDIRFWITTDGQHPAFPFKAQAELLVSIGSSLLVSLTTSNQDDKAFQLSQALHTYFSCDNIDLVKLQGIEGHCYLDKLTHKNHYFSHEFSFDQEIDWVVMDQGQPVAFTGLGKRSVGMTRMGSRSLVIWNPWIEKSKSLSHFQADEYKRMFCVETTNTSEDSRLLKPNTSHAMLMEIVSEPVNEAD